MLKGATNMAPVILELELTAVNNQSAASFMTGINALAPPANWNLFAIDGSGRVDVGKIAVTAQTARDIGASVLLSAGTGTGQIDLTAGVVTVNYGAVADAVWDEATSGHVTAGSTGAAIIAAGSAGDPWSTTLPGAYGAGTAGKIVGDNLNATVSSRSTYAGGDTAGTTTLLSRLTAPRALLLDNLDTTVSSRMATFAYVTPDNASITAIKAKTDNLPAAPAAVGDIPTALQNADALLNRDMSAVSDTNARSPLNALRALRNKWSIAAGTYTVTKENDSTVAWTSSLTTDAAAVPLIGSDPA